VSLIAHTCACDLFGSRHKAHLKMLVVGNMCSIHDIRSPINKIRRTGCVTLEFVAPSFRRVRWLLIVVR
jgi:hypothetical protein